MIVRCSILAVVCCATGCSSPTTRPDYPRYYGQWQHLGQIQRAGLDAARLQAAANPEDLESILAFARVASRLAREEASRWFDSHDRMAHGAETQRLRVIAARSRLLDSCHHAGALYREAQLKNATLLVDDRLNLVWLRLFSGNELEAEALLDSLSADYEFPYRIRHALDQVRAQLTEQLDRDVDE